MSKKIITWSGCMRVLAGGVFLAGALLAGAAEELPVLKGGSEMHRGEKLPELKAGSETYRDVTITSVTAMDIYFEHSLGIGNVKLKNLSPELQKQFGYDAAKAGELEQKQRTANTRYREDLKTAAAKKTPAPKAPASAPKVREQAGKDAGKDASSDDIVVPEIHARSFRGRPAPQIVVDQWLTSRPDVTSKFVLVDFWATWCGPCRQAIPHLNALQAKFKDRIVVIGLSDERPEVIRKMKSPNMEYSVGTDEQARTMREVQVQGIPHAMLIDPKGIVRFEGMPHYLTEPALAKLIAKYSE